MRTRSLIILAAVTAVALIGAVAAYSARSARHVADTSPDRLMFPGLTDRANDVAAIRVRKGDTELLLRRRGDEWVLASHGDYPAEFPTIKKTVMQVADLRPVEPKTAKPDLYARIGVQDPGPDADGMLVSLLDQDDGELASVIVGNRTWQGGKSHVYVRKPGEAQSWLAQGQIDADAFITSWVQRELVRIDAPRIRSVTVTHPDGQSYTLSRASASETNFSLENPPEGRSLTSPSAGNPIANNLTYLGLADVMAEEGAPLDPAQAVVATYRTFDGLEVTVRTVEHEGATWARISARALPDPAPEQGDAPPASADPAQGEPQGNEPAEQSQAAPATPESPAPAAEQPEEPAAEPADQPAEQPEQAEPSPADKAAADAEAINRRCARWWFKIDEWKAGNFRKRLDDLLTPAPAPQEEAGPPAPESEPSPQAAPILDVKPPETGQEQQEPQGGGG